MPTPPSTILELQAAIQEELLTAASSSAVDTAASINFQKVNEFAATTAQNYTYDLIRSIDDTTRNTLQGILEKWAATPGATLPDLIQSVKDSWLFSPDRAERIAVTEATRIYGIANAFAISISSKDGKRWMTAVDELVCNVCGSLSNKVIPKDQVFPLAMVEYPPAHVNCRCIIRPADFMGERESFSPVQHPFSPAEAFAYNKQSILFRKLIQKYQEKFTEAENKHRIASELSERTNLPYPVVNAFIKAWANSSNKGFSVIMQNVVRDKWGVTLSRWQNKIAESYNRALYSNALPFIQAKPSVAKTELYDLFQSDAIIQRWLHHFERTGDVLLAQQALVKDVDTFVTAVYDSTQAFLRSTGFDKFVLVRGIYLKDPISGELSMETNALSSWTLYSFIADSFGNHQIWAEIPVSRVWSTCLTGVGCLWEYELVVLGTPLAKERITIVKTGV